MDSEEQFGQLARRDEELSALGSRGRRRSLLITILAFVPIPFVPMKINDDRSLLGVIPLGITCVVAISPTHGQSGSVDRMTPSRSHS